MIRKVNSVIIFFSVYQILFNIIVLHLSSVDSKPETIDEKIDVCKNSEFQCKNGRCISKSFVCDGLMDCSDNSDETYDLCHNLTCGKQYFQCHYGACINKTYRCDGLKQCVDGSDEFAEICDAETHESIRDRRATENSKSCTTPPASLDKTVKYLCADNTTLLCDSINGSVPDLTIALINCTSGYGKEKQNDEEENTEFICRNKKWLPKIAQCFKICDKLNPVNVDFQCFRNGLKISCDENTILLHGTKVRPSCKQTHKYSSDSPPNYSEITCNSDGKWDNTLFTCIPECGRTYTNPQLLIKGGTLEQFGDSPWHVAIYNKKRVLICGGTIITPYLVISAAHCFHEESKSPGPNEADNYEVVVGKFTRNYDTKDSEVQKIHKIKTIRFSEKGYQGASSGFQSDIAILVLKEKLNISFAILPACIDWVALRDGIYPADETLGKVVGWGMNEHGNYNDSLATADLPFISHKRCLETVPEGFRRYITFDKFCAGSENGSGVLQGDSGGGLLFKKNNYYFLQGIVSIKEPKSTGIAAFTDIAEHVVWISKVRNEVEEELKKNSIQINTITAKVDDMKFSQNSTTNRPPMNLQISTPTMPPTNKSASIALENCKKYAEYRNVRKWQPAMANRAEYWYKTMDCVNVMPLIINGVQAKPKEYPHLARIGYVKKNEEHHINNAKWMCSGSLISERFILTAAKCILDIGELQPLWVSLGDLNTNSTNDDARPAVYDIGRVYIHPNYKMPDWHHHDVSLLELNTDVAMNPYVRPACLYTSTSNLVNKKGSIAGWGAAVSGGKRSPHLLKGIIKVLDDRQCSVLYQKDFNSSTMLCAADLENGQDGCAGDVGIPLQMPSNEQCMWNIFGIAAFGVNCGMKEYPAVYTKVAYYLDWIQSIVWP